MPYAKLWEKPWRRDASELYTESPQQAMAVSAICPAGGRQLQLSGAQAGLLVQVDLRQYIYELMVSTGGCASAGYPIASCKIYSDKSYAFLEFRSVEEASNCMAFDGVAFKDSYLRVRCSDRKRDCPSPPSRRIQYQAFSCREAAVAPAWPCHACPCLTWPLINNGVSLTMPSSARACVLKGEACTLACCPRISRLVQLLSCLTPVRFRQDLSG